MSDELRSLDAWLLSEHDTSFEESRDALERHDIDRASARMARAATITEVRFEIEKRLAGENHDH